MPESMQDETRIYRFMRDDEVQGPSVYVRTRSIACVSILVILLSMIIGFLIGFFIPRAIEHAQSEKPSALPKNYQEQLKNLVEPEKLETLLRSFSQRPHIGGSEESHRQAQEIADTWRSHKFDRVEMPSYDVLLSFPDPSKPNKVQLVHKNGSMIFQARTREKILEPSENDSTVVPPFLAYCPAGDITGELVYANYGRTKDFLQLQSLGVNITGRIVIMRYGKAYRGSMVTNAHRFGAIGALMFSDPSKYAPHGTDPANIFPNTWWLPGDGVQRGTALNGFPGDPLTPILPSTAGAHRLKLNSTRLNSIPKIPCHAIGYDDAKEILRQMTGQEAPATWKGDLPIIYRLGPGFNPSALQLRMEINNKLSINTTYNIIATITGREEPDRLILMGNHRDSWVFGAVDPVTATAATMETARGLSQLLKDGWRPRRTIMLCNWGAEEHGIIGSTEWIEENLKMLSYKAVVYLNMDIAVNGNFSFFTSSSPLLYSVVKETMKKVSDPHSTPGNHVTLYDVMAKSFPSLVHPGQPSMITLPSGSDFHSFFQFLGVPYADWGYFWSQANFSFSYTGYPVYHTSHETFYWYKQFLDPRFEFLRSVTQFTSLLLLECSDSKLIPFTLEPYSTIITNYITNLQNNDDIKSNDIDIQPLKIAVESLTKTISSFEAGLKNSKNADLTTLRILNDRLMYFERAFVYPYGIPGIPTARHVIFAPNIYNMAKFKGATFPTIGNAMEARNWEQVKEQVSLVTWTLHSATKLLTI